MICARDFCTKVQIKLFVRHATVVECRCTLVVKVYVFKCGYGLLTHGLGAGLKHGTLMAARIRVENMYG